MHTNNNKKTPPPWKWKWKYSNRRQSSNKFVYTVQTPDTSIQYRCANYIRRVWLSFVLSAYCFSLCIRYKSGVCIVVKERCGGYEWKWRGSERRDACGFLYVLHNAMKAIRFVCYAMNSCRRRVSSCDWIKHKFTLFHLNLTIDVRGTEPKIYLFHSP